MNTGILFLFASLVAAPSPDYDLKSDQWNGLQYLLTTATEANVTLEPVETLDLGLLRKDDVVFLLRPPANVPTASLIRFVRDGGSLIVADDHGHAGSFLSELGMTLRVGPPTRHDTYYQNKTQFPELKATRKHFLFFNIKSVVANHPNVILGQGSAVLSYTGKDEHLVVEQRLGHGSILYISDASIFLNQMLRRFYGNKQFAANVLRIYCVNEPCKVQLVTAKTQFKGDYHRMAGPLGNLARLFNDAGAAIDSALQKTDAAISKRPTQSALVWLGLIAALVLLLAGIGKGRAGVTLPSTPAGIEGLPPTTQDTIEWVEKRSDANFHELTTILLQAAQAKATRRALRRHASHEDPSQRSETIRRALANIEAEARNARMETPTNVSEERFLQLYSDVRTVLKYAHQPEGQG